jgi:hypothetical protein
MSVTVDDVREDTPNDRTDAALQRILDANLEAIDRSAGKADVATQAGDASGSEWFFLDRLSTSITTVTERRRHTSDAVTLSADDFRKVGDRKFLRLTDGTNPASFWGKEVVFTYVPEVDADMRDLVTLQLCKMDLAFQAFDREKSGADWEGEQKDYKSRRRGLFRQIREGLAPII